MIGGDQHAVRAFQQLRRQLLAAQIQIVPPHRRYLTDERIVVTDISATGQQPLHQDHRWRLPGVVHIPLVCDRQHQDLGPVDRLPLLVERLTHPRNHIIRHLRVDLPGQFDKLGTQPELPSPPAQIERIDGDAMASQAGARIKCLKPKWLCLFYQY